MKLKKVLALTLAAAMTFSLVACGGSSAETEDAPAAETTEETTADDTAADADAEAADDTTADAESAAPAEGVPTYSQITLGQDYTDLTASIKYIHCRTDREEDGTFAKLVEEFNKEYPNITVETEGITDYAEDSLLRLSTGDWGDIMLIPAVDKAELPNYFIPYDTLENMQNEINFADQWQYDGMSYGVPCLANAQGVV